MTRIDEREAALRDLVTRVVELAEPEDALEAYAGHGAGTSISVFDGEVEKLTSSESRGVGVRIIRDGRLGFAATSDVSEEGLRYAVREARSNAEFGTADPGNRLPEAQRAAGLAGLVDPALADVPAARKVAMALELERLARVVDPRVTGVQSANYGDGASSMAIASTAGVLASYSRTDAWATVSALARDGDETQTAFGLTDGRGVADLDLEAAAREAGERSARLLGARKPATATVPVVFDPLVAAQFLGTLADAFSAESVQKGRSLLADRLGERIAADGIAMVDDGRLPHGPGSAPFDDEGVPTGRTELVTGGLLRAYLHNTETAARAADGARSTGNAARAGHASTPGVAPTNLYLEGPAAPVPALLREAGTGLYVQDVSGVHSGVNTVSGEFSVGATGLWIRGGELAEPVRELTVSSTLLDMLRTIVRLGDDRRFFPFGGSLAGCSLLLSEMTVAGS